MSINIIYSFLLIIFTVPHLEEPSCFQPFLARRRIWKRDDQSAIRSYWMLLTTWGPRGAQRKLRFIWAWKHEGILMGFGYAEYRLPRNLAGFEPVTICFQHCFKMPRDVLGGGSNEKSLCWTQTCPSWFGFQLPTAGRDRVPRLLPFQLQLEAGASQKMDPCYGPNLVYLVWAVWTYCPYPVDCLMCVMSQDIPLGHGMSVARDWVPQRFNGLGQLLSKLYTRKCFFVW